MSPFLTRIASRTVPVADLTGQVAVAPQTVCPACGMQFAAPVNRNIHLMKRHADRRVASVTEFER